VAGSAVLGQDVAAWSERCDWRNERASARDCKIHPGVVIGDDVLIGDDCEFFPNVVVRERITIGNRVIIHATAVLIGSDGFGYRWDGSATRRFHRSARS